MIDKLALLRPTKERLNLFIFLGFLFFGLGIYDLVSNSFLSKNITSFLPGILSYFTPLIFVISFSEKLRVPPFDLFGLMRPSFSKNLIREIDTDGNSFLINLDASPIFITFQLLLLLN